MKKLLLTVLTILTMSLASFGENGAPHTKVFNDLKGILEKYYQSVNKAQTCDELVHAMTECILEMESYSDSGIKYEGSESLAKAEEEELNFLSNMVDTKVFLLQVQWQCPPDDYYDEYDDEDELFSTSAKEWDDYLDSFDAVTKKLNGMKNWDYSSDEKMAKLLETLSEAETILSNIQYSDDKNRTKKQSKRLDEISEQFREAAKEVSKVIDRIIPTRLKEN